MGRKGHVGWTRWIQNETLRRENWNFGRRRDFSGVNDGRKRSWFWIGDDLRWW